MSCVQASCTEVWLSANNQKSHQQAAFPSPTIKNLVRKICCDSMFLCAVNWFRGDSWDAGAGVVVGKLEEKKGVCALKLDTVSKTLHCSTTINHEHLPRGHVGLHSKI
jgi:hypothetical protein